MKLKLKYFKKLFLIKILIKIFYTSNNFLKIYKLISKVLYF